ncbi:hypothetical protein L195_g001742 [Trifolium pratense]|uniref:Uncharacterized protein n=1 Tax=Trifolium pratense TaxID=57577 RepID=A0A2K3NQK6_TRIPR|nr:hypothetical protein L195_g001742 [Trifolium pratense]
MEDSDQFRKDEEQTHSDQFRLRSSIDAENGLNMYLNLSVRGSIHTEGKNSTSEGGGEDREVTVSGPPKLVGP